MRSRIFVVLAVTLAGFLGCENRPAAFNEQADGQIQDDLQADEILATVLQQYQSATAYQDKAVMYLSYRLDGRAIQEPHPWSVAWDRGGRYSADLFNAKIRCDSKQLSCYVFDIETGNIDNQHLLVEANRFGVLLNDPIASHFIFGTSELPLFEEEAKHRNRLVPPMIGFADTQLLPTWLTEPDAVRRLSDDDSTGSKCYVLELVQANRIYKMWIEQALGMIEQVQLPLEYLDSQILASEQVSELRFFVRYHDAAMNVPIDPEQFAIKERFASKIVKRFVTLPEPMPSDRIGEKIESWNLVGADGEPYKMEATAKSFTLVWLVGGVAQVVVRELNELKPTIRKNIAVVYSDDLLEAVPGGERRPESELRVLLDEAGLRYLYDPQMKSSSQFKLKSVPSFVVLDGTGRMQFAKTIDNNEWGNELTVAVTRVESGENLAAEIRQEYQEFLDSYHLQIAQNATSETSEASAGIDWPHVGQLEQIASLMWESSEFKNPGNILIQNGRTFVIDGWQTIVELDASGAVVNRQRLSIPNEAAVNRLRSIEMDGKVYFAAYGMLGRSVFVFDENWKPIRQFPDNGDLGIDIQLGVTECQFVIEKGEVELWIASMADGMFRLNLVTDEIETMPSQSARGFYRFEGGAFRIVDSKLELNGVAIDSLIGWRVNAIEGLQRGCLVTASNSAGSWQIFALDEDGQLLWKDAIPPQYLENEVQPLVANERTGIVLGNRGTLTIFSAEGILRSVRISGEPSGVALDWEHGWVLISNGPRLSAWEMREPALQVIPASTQLKTRK